MSNETSEASKTIGSCCSLVLFNLILGGWSVWYLVLAFLHQHIAWGWAVLAGLIAGEVTIPIAFVVLILKHAHVI